MKAIDDYQVCYQQAVAWGDMDAFGHVNNVMFYRYIESARIHYLGLVDAFADGNVCVVASSSCKFMAPVHYPDTLRIGVCVTDMRTAGFMMEYGIYSTSQNKMVAVGDAVIVMMNEAVTSKVAISEAMRSNILRIEQGAS